MTFFHKNASRHRKEGGMSVAASAAAKPLEQARWLAKQIATQRNSKTCTADDVAKALRRQGLPLLGPAAGSLFLTKDWEFTGRRVLSGQVANHARELKVWRLR